MDYTLQAQRGDFRGISMGFPRQEHYGGLPFPPQRIFLSQGSNTRLLGLRIVRWAPFTTSTIWEAIQKPHDHLIDEEIAFDKIQWHPVPSLHGKYMGKQWKQC